MKIFRIVSALVFLAAVGSLPVFAQGARPGSQNPAAGSAASVPAPAAKIAIIDVEAFYDEKAGITRLVAALQQVNREFKPRTDEIQALQADIAKRTSDLQALANSSVADPTKVGAQSDQLDQMKKDLQRKVEDGQAALKKRMDAVRAPIEEEIGKAIGDFATKRGITFVVNISQMAQGVIWAAPGVDVTTEFIAEFNAKTPSATSRP
jgi:Skp family chaperone for outer membrane proteins